MVNKMINKIYCPYCGADVTKEKETEFGIFCPNGCGDFWKSEAIPKEELQKNRSSAYDYLI